MLPLWLFWIAAVLYCTYRLFFRRPTFYDVAADMVGEYPLRDNVEREIIDEIRRMQEDGDISPDKLEELAEAWEENERQYDAKSHKTPGNPENSNDYDNNTKE
jgi:hypothetical protein